MLKITSSLINAEQYLILDISNLAYRALYGNEDLYTTDGTPSGHVFASINMLLSFLRNETIKKNTCIVYCYDGLGAKEKRQLILPSYKADRKSRDFSPIPDVEYAMRLLPGAHIKRDEFEGDDAICYMTEALSKRNRSIVVYTGDKDLVQLIRLPNVNVYSPNLKRNVTIADIEENYKVTDPGKIPLAKSLFGDASDNITGVPYLLKKHITEALNHSDSKDAELFYDVLRNSGLTIKPKTLAKLYEYEDRVKTNYKVILPATGMSTQDIKITLSTEEKKQELENFLIKFECYSLLSQIDIFYDHLFA